MEIIKITRIKEKFSLECRRYFDKTEMFYLFIYRIIKLHSMEYFRGNNFIKLPVQFMPFKLTPERDLTRLIYFRYAYSLDPPLV